MAVFDDVLTTEGQQMLMKMLSGEIERIDFTRMVLGDGSTSKELTSITEVVHPVTEVQIDNITRSAANDVTITATFKNTDISEGFYMREKALFATDGTDEVLVIYANAGSLAEYIEPASSAVYEKVIRSIIIFSQSDRVNITVNDDGYASAIDLRRHIEDFNNPHQVNKSQVGLGNVPNVTTNNQAPTFSESATLVNIESGDTLSTIFSKIKKAITDFIAHIKLMASSTEAGHVKVTASNGLKNTAGTIGMDTGTASAFGTVKLSDSYTTSAGAAAAGVGASSKAVYDAYNALAGTKAPNNHADTSTAYGSGTATNYGHVKLSDTYDTKVASGAAANGMAASQNALYESYNELNTNLINKIAIDDVEVSTIAGQDYVYYPVRQGYTLFNAYTNEYNGTAVEKIAYAGSSSTYIIFFDVAPSTNGKIPLKFIWVKN